MKCINRLEKLNLNMPKNIMISVMNQYFPTYKAKSISDLSRKLTRREQVNIEKYLYSLDLERGFIQDLEKNEEKYVPNWKNVTIL